MRAGQKMPAASIEKMRSGLLRFYADNPDARAILRAEALERWADPEFRRRRSEDAKAWWTPERREMQRQRVKERKNSRKETA